MKKMKIKIKIFSFDMFGWKENWEKWKHAGQDYYVLKWQLYIYVRIIQIKDYIFFNEENIIHTTTIIYNFINICTY